MKVLLISANTEQGNMSAMPLGLACVAEAVKKAGHAVTFLDLMFEADINSVLNETIVTAKPDCIGISVRNIDNQSMGETVFLLEKIKEVVAYCRSISDAPLVLGGAGYTIFPDEVLAYLNADMGIEGEGEVAFPALLSALENGVDTTAIPGIHIAGEKPQHPKVFSETLDMLPLPDPAVLLPSVSKNPDPWIPVQTRRGCPFKCSYCSTANIEGTAIRKRSPEAIVAWLEQWVQAGYRNFYFVDNTFNLPAAYAKALCRQIQEKALAINWSCIIYPGHVDAELVKLMAEAGCHQVSLGFESGSREMLKMFNKRFSPENIRKAADLFAEHHIARMGFLMLGGPGETKASVEESFVFTDSLHLDTLRLTTGIRIYPDTRLAEIAEEKGIIASQKDLLAPQFYIEPELKEWLPERMKQWASSHPNIII